MKMDLDNSNFKNLIFAKLYDDDVPDLPWPKLQRLLLLFRLMFRIPLVAILEDYATNDRLANENENRKGVLSTAARIASKIKMVTSLIATFFNRILISI